MIDTGIPPHWVEQWNEIVRQLHDPLKLRVTSLAVVGALGFLGVYRPMDAKIEQLRVDVTVQRNRARIIRQVETLRENRELLLTSFPEEPTLNFWTAHFLAGIRDSGVQLSELESFPKKIKMGKLQVTYFDLTCSGSYAELHQLLSWVEDNDWYMRVIRFAVSKKHTQLTSKITVAVLAAQDGAGGV